MSLWKKIQPRQGEPSPEALAELEKSKKQLAQAEAREPFVNRVSVWLDHRNEENHFGDAVDISFTPRRRHA